MAECPVVPFFGAFLRELREILSAGAAQGAPPPGAPHEVPLGGGGPQDVGAQLPPKPKSGPVGSHRDQMHHRQVVLQAKVGSMSELSDYHSLWLQFISDYDGEDHHFTKIGPGGLINLEKIYRTQAVMDHISLCHQHYHTRNRLSPTSSLIDYLKCSTANEQRVLAAAPPEKTELDSEYDCDVDDYHPVQPLIHDHGVSFVCLSSPHTKVDQHVMQVFPTFNTFTTLYTGHSVNPSLQLKKLSCTRQSDLDLVSQFPIVPFILHSYVPSSRIEWMNNAEIERTSEFNYSANISF